MSNNNNNPFGSIPATSANTPAPVAPAPQEHPAQWGIAPYVPAPPVPSSVAPAPVAPAPPVPPSVAPARPSLFAGVPGAQPQERGAYFAPGVHRVILQRIKVIESNRNPGTHLFVIETQVHESSDPATAPGSNRSQVIKMAGHYWQADVQAFARAVLSAQGQDPGTLSAATLDQWVAGDGTAAAGTTLEVECWSTPTQKGGEFTMHAWRAPTTTPLVAPAPAVPGQF